jgi:hypothetical protein
MIQATKMEETTINEERNKYFLNIALDRYTDLRIAGTSSPRPGPRGLRTGNFCLNGELLNNFKTAVGKYVSENCSLYTNPSQNNNPLAYWDEYGIFNSIDFIVRDKPGVKKLESDIGNILREILNQEDLQVISEYHQLDYSDY